MKCCGINDEDILKQLLSENKVTFQKALGIGATAKIQHYKLLKEHEICTPYKNWSTCKRGEDSHVIAAAQYPLFYLSL